MVNQRYVENEYEEIIDRKQDVLNQTTSEKNIYFSKYFGENAYAHLIDFLNLKAKHQKVVFLVSEEDYLKYSTNSEKYDFEPIILAVDSFDYKTIKAMANTIDDSIRFILAIGGDKCISVAKQIAKIKNISLVLYINKCCSLDSFINTSYLIENNIMQCKKGKGVDALYIETDGLVVKLDRQALVDSVFNIISKLGIVVELYINCCISKDNGYKTIANEILRVYSKLNKILDNAIDLSREDVLSLMDLNIELADILARMKYNGNDKESIFAFVYKYLNNETKLSVNALRAVGTQVFIKLYKDFVINLHSVSNTFFDIEKRVMLFDATFKYTNMQFDLSVPITDKQIYMLKRFQSKLLEKINIINVMIDKLMYKTLDLYNDSGYLFLNSVAQETVLKSVYFTADIVEEKTLLKVMRNLGVLDFYS